MRQIELNLEEKKIIEAYRKGADVEIRFHDIQNFEMGMIRVMRFGAIDAIKDFTKNTKEPFSSNFITFEKTVNQQLRIISFVDVERK